MAILKGYKTMLNSFSETKSSSNKAHEDRCTTYLQFDE
jgi:hypothetical protein